MKFVFTNEKEILRYTYNSDGKEINVSFHSKDLRENEEILADIVEHIKRQIKPNENLD